MLRRFSKISKYLRTFGAIHGSRLWVQVEIRKCRKNSNLIRTLTVPGYPSPIYIRDTIADHAIFWQCIVMEQYDFFAFPQSQRLITDYQNLVMKGEQPLIIDCGGNIGLASLWLAKKFSKAKIYTIEPDLKNFELLKRNTASLGEMVVGVQGGIWNKSENLQIINPDSGAAAFRVEVSPANDTSSIPSYTIDDICKMANVGNPFIVKIDIEGGQANLFKNNTQWVAKTNLITLELDDWLFPWGGTSQSFFSTVSQYPFDYLIRDESIFCFRNFEDPISS